MKLVLLSLVALGFNAYAGESLDVRAAVQGFFALNAGTSTSYTSVDGSCTLTMTDNLQTQTLEFNLKVGKTDAVFSSAADFVRREVSAGYNDRDDTFDKLVDDFGREENSFWLSESITSIPREADRDVKETVESETELQIDRRVDGTRTVTISALHGTGLSCTF